MFHILSAQPIAHLCTKQFMLYVCKNKCKFTWRLFVFFWKQAVTLLHIMYRHVAICLLMETYKYTINTIKLCIFYMLFDLDSLSGPND